MRAVAEEDDEDDEDTEYGKVWVEVTALRAMGLRRADSGKGSADPFAQVRRLMSVGSSRR